MSATYYKGRMHKNNQISTKPAVGPIFTRFVADLRNPAKPGHCTRGVLIVGCSCILYVLQWLWVHSKVLWDYSVF
jgi:hypothetical protein